VAKEIGAVSWKELALGTAILKPGCAAELKTGDWRSMYPVTDWESCTKCGQCYIFCPDMVYSQNEEGYYEQNYYYCKGCGICAKECPVKCIQMVEEGK
jgi:pyruvate ferredoxin oxidoreductase delta subunit